MDRSQESENRQWQSHPARAASLRALAFVLPLIVSVIVGMAVGALMPAPRSTASLVLWWAAVLASSTLAVYATDRVTRKVLPLATLMRLSILFPDRAPSRLKVARKVSGSRAIAAELAKAGMASDRQEAAETILALVGALGDYDARTRGHSERTQLFVTMLADELKLSSEDKGKLMWAALVHDIGKLKVPHEVLNKPAKPTEEEWELLHSHPHHGAEICEPLREWLGPWWLAIEQHHEKYDGSGYPHALAGREISYGARIVAVADSYEVMTASRPYKRPMTASAARAELTACAGSHFDPDIVRAFLNISLGGIRRSTGPLAWLAQIFMVRPGPLLGQVMGAGAGAVGAAATVIGLNMVPGIAHAEPATTAQPKPPVTAPTQPAPAQTPPATTPEPRPTPTPGRQAPGPAPSATAGPRPATPSPPVPGLFALTDDVESTIEDTARVYDVLANDAMSGVVEIAGVTDSARGASSIVGDKVLFEPDPDVNGTETFTYTVRDGFGRLRTAQVTVEVVPVNDAPLARNDSLVVAEDAVDAPLRLLDNDIDVDGDTLTVTSVTGATNGTLTRGAGGFTYTPDVDFAGPETLRYTISDGNGGGSTATVSLTVAQVNDAPVARPDTVSMAEDSGTITLGNLLGNDTDVENDSLKVTAVTGAVHGTIAQPTSGVFTYTPHPDFYGVETLGYAVSDGHGGTDSSTVRITVTPVNDAPRANDDTVTAAEDSADVPLDLLGNDVDVDGDTLVVTGVTGAVNGTLTEQSPGVWTYTPDANWSGVETLSYGISDGNGGTDTGTVTVTVTPVQDAPVAGDDAVSLLEDVVDAPLDLLGNDVDVDGDTLVVTGVTGAVNGTLTEQSPGVWTYTPDADWSGVETLSYGISDGNGGTDTGTVTVTVTPVQDAPVAGDDTLSLLEDVVDAPLDLLGNDVDVDGDTLVVTGVTGAVNGTLTEQSPGVWTYTPDADWSGVETLSYGISDGNGGTDTGTMTVTVTPVQDAPVAGDDTLSLLEDVVDAPLDLLGNDVDVDGDTLVVTGVTGAVNGTLTEQSPGVWTYTPDADWSGVETLSYGISDGNGGTDTGTVTVTVTPVQDAPVAGDDTVSLLEDVVDAPLDLLGNDVDVDGDTLVVTGVTGAVNGTLTEQSPGVWTYTPDANWSGVETLSYDISDGNGGTASASVAVTITAVNDAPVAGADTLTIAEGSGPATLDLLGNDTDVEGDTLTVTGVTGAANGTITSPGGVWTYTPALNFAGVETLDYTVDDGNGGTDTGTMTVTVTPVQDPPVANDDTVSLLEDAIDAPLDLLGNDVDVDGDILAVTGVTGAVNGTLTEQSPGVWTYTPDADWNGVETLSYGISDGNGGTDTATVTVTVTAVNDAPVAGPDAYAVTAGQALTTTAANGVLSNDGDADGDVLRVTGDDSLLIDINADGSFTYLGLLPATVVVNYTVWDGNDGTATGTVTITVTLLPSSTSSLFLQPADTFSTGSLSTTTPAGGIADYDADGNPGLTVKSGGLKPDETDPLKYQEWSYPVPAGGLTMNGPITMDLWTSLRNQADKDLDYAVWLYDCNGPARSLLASTVGVHVDNWSTTTTWEQRTVTVGSTNTTVLAGHTLKVRLGFNHNDVWLPLDSAHPSSLTYTR